MGAAELLNLAGRAISVVLPMVIVFGTIGYFTWRKVKRRSAAIKRHRDAGTIGPARLFSGQDLPLHYDAIARIGTAGPAPSTLNEQTLRASLGVKLFVTGLTFAIGLYLFRPDIAPEGFHKAIEELPVPASYISAVVLFFAINGIVYIFGFEARYGRDALIVTRMMVSRREYLWRNLDWIGDDGAYEFVLRFEPGGKAKVLKHSVGIGEFKEFAMDQIRRNRSDRA